MGYSLLYDMGIFFINPNPSQLPLLSSEVAHAMIAYFKDNHIPTEKYSFDTLKRFFEYKLLIPYLVAMAPLRFEDMMVVLIVPLWKAWQKPSM